MSLNWTYQASIATPGAASRVQSAAGAPSRGVVMVAVTDTSTFGIYIFVSTNGGPTWTTQNTAAFPWGGQIAISWGGGTNWYAGPSGAYTYYSPDDGVTWTSHSSGTMTAQAIGAAFDGASTIIFQGGTGGQYQWTVNSTVSGANATWGASSIAAAGSVPSSSNPQIIWDGTQFVMVFKDSGGSNYLVYTAPSGFTQVAGPTWTLQQTTPIVAPDFGTGVSTFGPILAYMSSAGYITCYGIGGINVATSVSSLINNTSLTAPLGTATNYTGAWAYSSLFFTANSAGLITSSPDGVTWTTTGSSNFAVGGEYLDLLLFDPVSNNLIAIGSDGSVSTASAAFISISPTTANVEVNGGTQQFAATVLAGGEVAWAVDGIPGGNAAIGFINSSGGYAAPTGLTSMPTQLTHTISASSGGHTATAIVTLTPYLVTYGGGGSPYLASAFGGFRGANAFRPVSLTNVGTINPKIYAPGENTTITSQS